MNSVEKVEDNNTFNPICFSTEFDSKYCKCCCRVDSIWLKISQNVFHLVENKLFEFFIIFIIFLSSIALVITVPIRFKLLLISEYFYNIKALEDKFMHEKLVFKNVLMISDYIFTIIFTIEMILFWIGYGFRKYFSNGWCVLDFIIVCVSFFQQINSFCFNIWFLFEFSYLDILMILFGLNNFQIFKIMRTVRALRPLRALSRFNEMKV